MILVDTSVWVDHFRRADKHLMELLENRMVFGHPFVLGELMLGNLRQRGFIGDTLAMLRTATVAHDEEVQHLIVGQNLAGTGIGYVDAHLLAAS